MKKTCISLCCLLIGIANINAQDIFHILNQLNEKQPIIQHMDSIITYAYNPMNIDENRMPDTFVVVNEDSLDLFLQDKLVETFPSPGTKVGVYYDKDGKKKYTETTILSEEGLLQTHTILFGDKKANHFMNSTKSYQHENGKIAKVIENGTEILAIKYGEEGLPSSLQMNVGFVKMSFDREKSETGYIYHGNLVKGEEENAFSGFMEKAMKDMPKAYILCEEEGEKITYTHIEEDKTSQEIISKEVYIKNKQGQLLESIESKNIKAHKRYQYNAKGEVTVIENLTDEVKLINEFDEHGNYTKKHEDEIIYEYKYDSNQQLIEEREYMNFGTVSLTNMRIKKNFPKQ